MTIWRNILIFAVIAMSAFGCNEQPDKLPIFGHRQVNERLENGITIHDTLYHTIPDFVFTNQEGKPVSNKTFSDQVYVADFFFTSCPTICPIMETQMLRVHEAFRHEPEFGILSHTIDPEYDNVEVLRDYAERLQVSSDQWHFVTGDKDKIYEIGQKSYLVTAGEDEDAPGGYIHSGAFLLVDKERRIRGVYDGTKEDQVDRLIADVRILLKEYR